MKTIDETYLCFHFVLMFFTLFPSYQKLAMICVSSFYIDLFSNFLSLFPSFLPTFLPSFLPPPHSLPHSPSQAAERMRGRSQSTWLEVETDSVSLATTSAIGGISHVSFLCIHHPYGGIHALPIRIHMLQVQVCVCRKVSNFCFLYVRGENGMSCMYFPSCCVLVDIYVHGFVCVFVCVWVCVCVHPSMCVCFFCVCVCMCVVFIVCFSSIICLASYYYYYYFFFIYLLFFFFLSVCCKNVSSFVYIYIAWFEHCLKRLMCVCVCVCLIPIYENMEPRLKLGHVYTSM